MSLAPHLNATMIQTLSALEALRDDWDALAVRYRSPLLDHAWLLSCAETLYGDGELCILTVRRAGALAGAAALAVERFGPGRRLAQVGVSRLYEPCDWLAESPPVLTELVDEAVQLSRPIVLQRLPDPSLVVNALSHQPTRRVVTMARPSAPSLGVPTHGRWEDYWAGLPGRLKSNLRYARRKAEAAHGTWTIQREQPDLSEVDALLETFVTVEASGWKHRRGSSLGRRPDLRAFFRSYLRRLAARRELHVARLLLGSRVAAMEVAAQAHNRLWQLKIGYDEALRPYSPGMQLTASGIRWAFEHALEGYEFLGSAEPWEERWRPEVRRYQTVITYPTNLRGALAVAYDMAGALGRRLSLGRAGRSGDGGADTPD